MSQTYGATPGGTPATAGGAADAAPLLGKGLKGKKIGGAERLWMDMFIAVVSLVVIVGTFFVTIELMNYEVRFCHRCLARRQLRTSSGKARTFGR